MSQPYNYYVGDGATTSFEFTQELNDQAAVVGMVNYALAAGTYSSVTGFFTFSVAPASGVDIYVLRSTSMNTIVAAYPNKSYISSENLDADFRQLLNLAEELKFANDQSIRLNAGSPGYAAAAAASAAAALVSETNAAASEGFASTYASTAQTEAGNAAASAAAALVSEGLCSDWYDAIAAYTDAAMAAYAVPLDGSVAMTGDLVLSKNDPNIYIDSLTPGETSQVTFRDETNNQRMNLRYDDSSELGMLILRNAAQGVINQVQLNTDGNVSVVSAAAPTAVSHLTRKDYVDTKLPLVGGTLTGTLSVPGLFISSIGESDNPYIYESVDGGLTVRLGQSAAYKYLTLAVDGNISAISAVAPTDVSHLTRKDYVDGNRSITGIQTYISSNPTFRMYESDAAVNNRYWDVFVQSEQMSFRAVNDTYSAAGTWLTVDRTGITIDSVSIVAPSSPTTPTAAEDLTRKDYVDAQIASVSGSGVHAGRISSAGTVHAGTDAWTVSKVAVGQYQLTHNLGSTNYAVVCSSANVSANNPRNVSTDAKLANTVQFYVDNTNGNARIDDIIEYTIVTW